MHYIIRIEVNQIYFNMKTNIVFLVYAVEWRFNLNIYIFEHVYGVVPHLLAGPPLHSLYILNNWELVFNTRNVFNILMEDF